MDTRGGTVVERHAHLFALSLERVKEDGLHDTTLNPATLPSCNPAVLQFRTSLPVVGGDECDRSFFGELRLKQVGSRIAIHIAANRQAQEIEQRGDDVND